MPPCLRCFRAPAARPIARRAAALLPAALLLAALLPGARALAAQPLAQLSGRTLDDAGAPVAGVAVSAAPAAGGERRGALTAADGTFRLALAPGRYRLRAQRLGYRVEERELVLAAGQALELVLRLRAAVVPVEGLVARGDRGAERARFDHEAGVTARVISAEELKLLPGLAEPDLLRAVELLPGVVSTSDFVSAFNVRGGSADQNLILLDGFPIFNPFHLGGVFSVFNPDALARAELLSGGFSAEYGGRVSSVLNVESRPPEPGSGVRGTAGISLLATRLMLRGAADTTARNLLGGRGGGWLLSLRRSYFDQLLRPVTDFPYYLADAQAHATLGTPGGGRLRLTAYAGQDVLDLADFEAPGTEADSGSILRVRWDWGNQVIGTRWEQPLGAWVADTRLGYSRFATRLGFTDFPDTRFASRIAQLSLRSDLARGLPGGHGVAAGVEVARLAYRNRARAGGTDFGTSRDAGTMGAAYLQTHWEPGSRWILDAGLRADAWWAGSATRTTLSPRLAAKRFFGRDRDAALKLALGRYTQFLHSQRDEELPFAIDTWVLADRNVPAVVSDQLQLGFEKYWGQRWSASLEAYVRRFHGVTEINPADDPNTEADDLLSGRGLSYGADLLLRRSAGRLTGWTTLSLLRAERTFPDPQAQGWDDLPPEASFPPVFDRRVDLDVVLRYQLARHTDAGLRWNFGTGLPYTRPVAQYLGWQYDLGRGQLEPSEFGRDGEEPALYVVLGERNSRRYPAYHRLDVTLRRTLERRWGTLVPYVQVLNLYNQPNVLFYFYNYDRRPPTRSGISMFPLLPAFGLEATF